MSIFKVTNVKNLDNIQPGVSRSTAINKIKQYITKFSHFFKFVKQDQYKVYTTQSEDKLFPEDVELAKNTINQNRKRYLVRTIKLNISIDPSGVIQLTPDKDSTISYSILQRKPICSNQVYFNNYIDDKVAIGFNSSNNQLQFVNLQAQPFLNYTNTPLAYAENKLVSSTILYDEQNKQLIIK